jgi:predicted DNA-binding transcriptional regulator YafY
MCDFTPKEKMTLLSESTRVERVVYLTKVFLTQREISTAKAAQLTGVSQRTIQRDFAVMARTLEIYPDNGRWIYLDEETAVSISPY